MVGNPSISVEVSSYMCSLRRCKVQAGEVANSARAITSRGQSGLDLWGGGHVRRLLQAAYMVSFLCMLCFDEVLKIQDQMVLHLPFHKTHQNGEIQPFHLWSLLFESKITSGYLFQKIVSSDCIAEANSAMSSEQFLELFCNNLLDINIDPAPYGTHSFRRGGCQYLHVKKHWPLRRICEWGGWSTEFSNLTVVKYFISSNNDPAEPREYFFNPNRPPMVKCTQCGRCCACA
ncbi:uncharacterized protein HD556DRAFT_1433459 [Suillus plorans]|uniref:DNA breaking-rejoining enzyme n=1 Tax=Suillus plorans TaxID=116603 RepID=A0A9P7AIF1_9AGAM|nr:uncharacterized protein HD556DRAFT_1433459 [Suillus plorans]KAG1790223.1 hypothetical protein HD556DRAFT_1433459 [Suillus plorans]